MKKRILMIDDEPEFLEPHVQMLEDEFNIERAMRASNVEKRLQENDYDLIILDMLMPPVEPDHQPERDLRYTGRDLYDLIRQYKGDEIPIVVFSVVRDLEVRKHMESHKFTMYKIKPTSPLDLLKTVKDALKE